MDQWRALTERYNGEISCGLFLEHSNEEMTIGRQTIAALAARG
jgi:hypothetical protein